ncbi:flagellar basal body-associated FliL family protein [Niameybacter massiliensis]|uniref:flagellar basal body-associated FliL family protein n=1 Tax=Niameybacter massiliensis TaxID=1658108 RepID=UPI0006B68304|nr:flagellar basal body-associated FliL family protein [Niameybacter massiliensis]
MDKKFKIFVIISIIILTLVTVAGGVTVFMMMNDAKKETSSEEKVNKSALAIVYLDESVNANLKMDKDNIPHIARVSLGFEINTKDKDYKTFTVDFTEKQIIVRDKIISLIRSQTYNELEKDKLGQMIKKEINALLGTEIIQTVYFSDFFVQ